MFAESNGTGSFNALRRCEALPCTHEWATKSTHGARIFDRPPAGTTTWPLTADVLHVSTGLVEASFGDLCGSDQRSVGEWTPDATANAIVAVIRRSYAHRTERAP